MPIPGGESPINPEELFKSHETSQTQAESQATPVEMISSERTQHDQWLKSIGGHLDYEPFDASTALRQLHHGFRPQPDASPEDKRRILAENRSKIETIRQELNSQRLGAAETIQQLFDHVHGNPSDSIDNLMAIVLTAASKYKFTEKQLGYFREALEKYTAKHAIVEKYTAEYPAGETFYQACFDRSPQGEVELVKGPMTIHIACYNQQDFIWAKAFSRTQGDESKLNDREQRMGARAGGSALQKLKFPELNGVVTLESANETIYKPELIPTTAEVNGEFELGGMDLDGDVSIDIPGAGSWRLALSERSTMGAPGRFTLVSTGNVPHAYFDFRVVSKGPSDRDRVLVDELDSGQESQYEQIWDMRQLGGDYGKIIVRPSSITIVQSNATPISVTHMRSEPAFVNVPNEKPNQAIIDHEELHQFNRLFKPIETEQELSGIFQRVSVQGLRPSEINGPELLLPLARYERRVLNIDARARDEILAMYSDEKKSTAEILYVMTTSPLYAYFDQRKDIIDQLPEEMLTMIQDRLTQIFPDVRREEIKNLPQFSIEQVQKYINQAFEQEYVMDLKKWLGAIDTLEAKHYTHLEIISQLYQHPVNRWVQVANSLPDAADSQEKLQQPA